MFPLRVSAGCIGGLRFLSEDIFQALAPELDTHETEPEIVAGIAYEVVGAFAVNSNQNIAALGNESQPGLFQARGERRGITIDFDDQSACRGGELADRPGAHEMSAIDD